MPRVNAREGTEVEDVGSGQQKGKIWAVLDTAYMSFYLTTALRLYWLSCVAGAPSGDVIWKKKGFWG